MVFGQVKADAPYLVPQGRPPLQEARQPFTAGGNRTMRPSIQIFPNANEGRLVEILGALHRRDTQDQRRRFGRGGRRNRLQFQAGDLGRMAEGRQVANGELPPVGKCGRQRALEPLGRQQEKPLPLTDPENLCHPAQLPIRLRSLRTCRWAALQVRRLVQRDPTGWSQC